MKSFGQILKGQTRSPHRPISTAASTHSLADQFQQWQQYPEGDYTLYLGHFATCLRSQSSSVRLLGSKNPVREEEEIFDSWIQKQSVLNANKENISVQPKRRVTKQQQKLTFSSKINCEREKKGAKQIRAKESNKHVMQLKDPENMVRNIKMIKSNILESEEDIQTQERNYNLTPQDISLNYRQYQSEAKQNEEENAGEYAKREKTSQANSREEHQFRTDLREQVALTESEQPQQQKQPYSKQIERLVDHTSKHIHTQIAELANKYINQDQLRQSIQSQSVQEEEKQEDEDQLLIGGSDRKPLGGGDHLFSQDYCQKQAEQEEIERKRREDARDRINSMMKDMFSRNTKKDWSSPPSQPEGGQGQKRTDVGFSFASNAISMAEAVQLGTNQASSIKSPKMGSQGREGSEQKHQQKQQNSLAVERFDKKRYFSGLDIKESINIEDPNAMIEVVKAQIVEVPRGQIGTLLDGQLKQSLKYSIGNANGQFNFEF